MFKSKTEYLLPVFLDDTKVNGIPETQGYLINKSPYEVAVMFAKKMNKDVDVEMMMLELQQSLPEYEITIKGKCVLFLVLYMILKRSIHFLFLWNCINLI